MTARDPQPTDDEVWRDLVSRLSEPVKPEPDPEPESESESEPEPESEDEGVFVPEEPPPLGVGNPLLVLAWCGAVGGPLFLLGMAMFWRSAPWPAIAAVLAVFLASVAWLVFRLPKSRESDDDGAVL